jgi:hypothetical protein
MRGGGSEQQQQQQQEAEGGEGGPRTQRSGKVDGEYASLKHFNEIVIRRKLSDGGVDRGVRRELAGMAGQVQHTYTVQSQHAVR